MGKKHSDAHVLETLSPLMTEARRARIETVLEARTYGVTVVLEDLYDDGNISAVLRTCDAFGIQRVHVIRTNGAFKSDRKVSQGAHKWLEIVGHDSVESCVQALRADGYRIYASRLDESCPLEAIDFDDKVALVFGNEAIGVSDALAAACDGCFIIPMAGFTQSFNVSVAAAITVFHASEVRRREGITTGALTEVERGRLRATWYRRSVRASDLLLSQS